MRAEKLSTVRPLCLWNTLKTRKDRIKFGEEGVVMSPGLPSAVHAHADCVESFPRAEELFQCPTGLLEGLQ